MGVKWSINYKAGVPVSYNLAVLLRFTSDCHASLFANSCLKNTHIYGSKQPKVVCSYATFGKICTRINFHCFAAPLLLASARSNSSLRTLLPPRATPVCRPAWRKYSSWSPDSGFPAYTGRGQLSEGNAGKINHLFHKNASFGCTDHYTQGLSSPDSGSILLVFAVEFDRWIRFDHPTSESYPAAVHAWVPPR